MFEAVQFVEMRSRVEPVETLLGEFVNEQEAVEAARRGKIDYTNSGSHDFAWWIVRRKGAALADFISDSTSSKEFILDLESGELIEVH